MQLFQKLGEQIQSRWDGADCDPAAFPEIATNALGDSGVFDRVRFEDVVEWFMTALDLPDQKLSKFGQPPIRAYVGRGFYIEILFWVDSPTTIHHHSFSGVFGVLHGSSFHSTYAFAPEERLCRELCIGDLRFDSAEVLGRGDFRSIHAGGAFIHALLHLNSPSVSIVIRTNSEPAHLPQFNYVAPGLAWDPVERDIVAQRRLQLMRTLYRSHPYLFADLARKAVASGDWWHSYQACRVAASEELHSAITLELQALLRRRHARLAGTAAGAFREMHRERLITRLMKSMKQPEMRLLLAMLLRAPDRTVIEDLIRRRFPQEEPLTKLLGLVDELAARHNLGTSITRPSLLLGPALRGEGAPTSAELRRDWHRLHTLDLFRPLFSTVAA